MKLINVSGSEELLQKFCQLPQEIYRDQDKKFAMSEGMCRKLLSLSLPFDHGAFLIQDDSGKNLGRIFLQASSKKFQGHWSFLALAPDFNDASGLDAMMKEWFEKRGIFQVIGPYYFTTYFSYRMRVDQDSVTYPWEPKQPPYELSLFQSMGHKTHQTYYSYLIKGFGHFDQKGKKEYESLLKDGFTFRPIRQDALEEEIKILYDLSMKGFTDNYLFEPIPFELFKEIYVPSFKAVDLRMSCLMYSPEGKVVGFNFTFPQGHQAVIKSSCVLPEFRGKGLFSAGIYHGVLKIRELTPEVTDCITALVHVDNEASRRVADSPTPQERHEYALLMKDYSL